MKYVLLVWLLIGGIGEGIYCSAQNMEKVIRNGMPWFDDHGNIVNAHGACIVEEKGKYYLFGEWKSDESNAFPGFSCYSSDDLVNWKFERVVLTVQPDGILGPNRVGERVKVMKCPSTGEFVMFMHADDMGYKGPYIGYATCKTINGEYQLQGPLLYQGKPVQRWDMGTFQDTDGKGYLLIHHGPIYRLSDDYQSIEMEVAHVKGSGESPAMFKKDGIYYMLYSNLTSWEKNDNFYFTAPKIEGPWTKQGLFCPEGTLTYNSQSTFVFPLKRGNDTIPMFMGDRWSYPHQASAATYVWMPMQVNGTKLSIPEYWQCWDFNTLKPVDILRKGKRVSMKNIKPAVGWTENRGCFVSNAKGSVLAVPFRGTHVAVVGKSDCHSGYARVSVLNAKKDTVYSSLVDFYSKYSEKAIRIMTPEMEKGNYTLLVEVTGIKPVWTDKSKTIYGSDNTFVTIDDIYYF
ncbi:family 43 glycosylhydrolase [Bacteroides cellulosilyticus]|uniref:Family 43 glycosylhydrolase n=1 Tax=Bacteroides cellulosilyticus TaxID=246787 RepID=A0A5M6A7G6_9BACE|nr:family 43 glycosylhydrolase [Bacteroides cellulosilyticus]KAA5407746.1 family 43 glycosylhydrolase [Bacteroides cellulosilyticus]RYU16656.1 glycosyl hydrolase family 43 [Bacteroides cellulosilyticus]